MPTRYDPPFPPSVWIVAAVVALLAQAWFWRRTALRGWSRVLVCVCRLGAIAATAWLLGNPMFTTRDLRKSADAILLLDASNSMSLTSEDGQSRDMQANAVRDAVLNDTILKDRVKVVSFGERLYPDAVPGPGDDSRKTTRLGAALRELLAARGDETPLNAVVVVSDGATQDAPATSAMARLAANGKLPLAAMPVGTGSPVVNAAISGCLVERRAVPGTVLPVGVTVQRLHCQEQALEVTLVDKATGKPLDSTLLSARPGGAEMETVELHVTTGASPLQVTAKVAAVPGETTLADNEASFTVESTEPKIRVLYMEGTDNYNSLGRNEVTMLGDAVHQEDPRIEVDTYTLNVANSSGGSVLMRATWDNPAEIKKERRGYPRTKEELFRYDLVICSDIPQISFTKEQIDWTVELVAERGGGFVMIGGYTSFGTGQWDRTPWEKLIPVDMSYAGRGHTGQSFSPFWTDEGKRHPILANLPRQGESLDEILNAHPQFFGTNFINRSKPAAVTLMRMNDGDGQPIVTVQPFGKGRTMAFASDVTTGWGSLHDTAWGPRGDKGLGGLEREDVQSGWEEKGTPPGPGMKYPQPPANSYYRRFWTSSVHWLTEKSIAQNAGRFFAGCPSLTWPEDNPLEVYAVAGDPELSGRVSTWRTVAWVKEQPAARATLRWLPEGNRFTGKIPRPASLPEGENTVIVETVSPDQKEKYHAEFSVRVLPYDPEFSHPEPKPEVLEEMAATTGAPVLHRAAEVVEWLRQKEAAAEAAATESMVPAWDRWPFLALILGLLGVEWVVRRFNT